MKCFVNQARTKFDHQMPKIPQHDPHSWTAPIYVQRTAQRPTATNTSPLLENEGKKSSNPLLAPSSNNQISTRASKLHSTKFHPGNQNRHKKQWKMQHYDELPYHLPGRKTPLLCQWYDPHPRIILRIPRPDQIPQLIRRLVHLWLRPSHIQKPHD